ncbi:MAG: carboxylesterase family protein, partial [Microbacterium sp.]
GLAGRARRAYLAANRQQRRRGTAALLGRFVTDRVFRSLVSRVAAARASSVADPGEASTWVYRFSWRSPAIGWACHCLDVPFWFDCLDAAGVPRIAGDAPPQRLADEVHGAAAAFVRTGDPGWPAWRPGGRATHVFDAPASGVVADGYASVAALG